MDRAHARRAGHNGFFLEYDTGSENLHRVAAKLAGYRNLAARTGITTPVLFWLPTARREAALRALLAGHGGPGARPAGGVPGVPVATTTPQAATSSGGPTGPIWLPAGQPGPRLALAQAGGTTPPRHSRRRAAREQHPGWHGLPWHPLSCATARAVRSRHASRRRRECRGRRPRCARTLTPGASRSRPPSLRRWCCSRWRSSRLVPGYSAGRPRPAGPSRPPAPRPPLSPSPRRLPGSRTPYGIPWTVLAGGLAGNTWGGAPVHPASEHTGGYGIEGDHDGIVNVYDPADAIPSAASFLKAHGAPANLQAAIFAYNHSSSYVTDVLDQAARYAAGGTQVLTAHKGPACEQAALGRCPPGAPRKSSLTPRPSSASLTCGARPVRTRSTVPD